MEHDLAIIADQFQLVRVELWNTNDRCGTFSRFFSWNVDMLTAKNFSDLNCVMIQLSSLVSGFYNRCTS